MPQGGDSVVRMFNLLTCPTVLGATENQLVARVAHRRQPREARFADGQAGTACHLDVANGVKRMSVSMAVRDDTPLRHAKGLGLRKMSNWGWSAAHTPMYSNIGSEPQPWGVGANRQPCQTLSAA